MKIQEEIKSIAIHEGKSAYHKVRLIGAVVEKGAVFSRNKIKFIGRYINELKK